MKGKVSVLLLSYWSLCIATFMKPLHEGQGIDFRMYPIIQSASNAAGKCEELNSWLGFSSGSTTTDCSSGTAGLLYVLLVCVQIILAF